MRLPPGFYTIILFMTLFASPALAQQYTYFFNTNFQGAGVNASAIRIMAFEANTTVEVYDGGLLLSVTTTNPGERFDLYGSGWTRPNGYGILDGHDSVTVVTSKPVLAVQYYDCCNLAGAYFLPTDDGDRYWGRRFVVNIPATSYTSTVSSTRHRVLVYAPSGGTVTVYSVDDSGAPSGTVDSTTLGADGVWDISDLVPADDGTSTLSDAIRIVESTEDIAIEHITVNSLTEVPPILNGKCFTQEGTLFYLATNGWDGGSVMIANPTSQDATVVLTQLWGTEGGDSSFTVTVPAGGHKVLEGNLCTDENDFRAWKLTATSRVIVWGGDREAQNTGLTGIGVMGDDVVLSTGVERHDFMFAHQFRTYVLSTQDATITVDGAPVHVNEGVTQILDENTSAELILVHSPVPIYMYGVAYGARGTPGLNDWASVILPLNRIYDYDGDTLDDYDEGGLCGATDSDGDGTPDPEDTDDDDDGILTQQEVQDSSNLGSSDPDGDGLASWLDTDSDGDGMDDTNEGTTDTDSDGVPNYLDTDSDGDGISDDVEGAADPDGDGVPNYLDTDSDGDGISDDVEGAADPDGDSVPNYLDTDSDGDGLLDSLEVTVSYLDPYDPDSDHDTISDGEEYHAQDGSTGADFDGDGIPDAQDQDTDSDGIADVYEAGDGSWQTDATDTDGDGIPDFRDTDADGDGIEDRDEFGVGPEPADTDGDGIYDFQDTDSDNDGVPDATDNCRTVQNQDQSDIDSNGVGDACDGDADGDGIPNDQEGSGDADGDGVPNYLDTDADGDGISDATEAGSDPNVPVDSDGDTIPDYLDTDSDNDGVQDSIEGMTDTDSDTTPDYLDTDSDGDGVLDSSDNCRTVQNQDQTDTDGDGIGDACENEDADSDGIPDGVEGNGDADGDGTPNYLDTDSDGDGIPDDVEAGSDPANPVDSDADTTPDYLDSDSDNDGVQDSIEGTTDTDADTTPDYLDTDSDGDGVLDSSDNCRTVQNQDQTDTDGDGIGDACENEDADSDGIPDSVEGNGDADGDGTPNYLDTDSDGDGISDDVEAGSDPANPVDSDSDGTPDYLDTDSDGDTITDADEYEDAQTHGEDIDGDGLKNWLDTDSDADGKTDGDEGRSDMDDDGIPNYLDPVDMKPGLSGGAVVSCAVGGSSDGWWTVLASILMAMWLTRRRR